MNQPSHKISKTDWFFLLGLFTLVFFYFYKILGLKYGFYSGDHRQQHYPWAFFYAEQLKNGFLPWWTSLFHCGFPLLAEGQVGALYLPNFLFYRFFPFDFAYTYNILFHYCLGAFFFYAWIRQQGMSSLASFGGALLYLFGTAQGGYYYNIISLKTLIWFPLSLFWIHQIFKERKFIRLFPLALTFTMEWTAGYLQYAIYAVMFAGIAAVIYFLEDLREKKWKTAFQALFAVLSAVLVSILLAMPQLSATLELSRFSNRFQFPLEFAYLGSMNPLAAATLFFPHWDGFLGSEFYLGSIGLFFLILSFCSVRSQGFWRFVIGLGIALFLALGKWNPLFKWFIEWTHFSGFRISTKFLYFAGTYGAALCAFGMHHWLEGQKQKEPFAKRLWIILQIIAFAGIVLSNIVFRFFDKAIFEWGRSYLQTHFQQSAIHPHPMEIYLVKLRQYMDAVAATLSLSEFYNLVFMGFAALSILAVSFLNRRFQSRKKIFLILLVILFANLWIYGNTSIRGSIVSRSFLNADSRVMDFLKQQDGRVQRLVAQMQATVDMEVVPHNLMLGKVSMLGAYSPFVMFKYYEWMEGLGDVNDSNVQKLFKPDEQPEDLKNKLKLMDAKWIVSDQPLDWPELQLSFQEKNQYVYFNQNNPTRFSFIPSISEEVTSVLKNSTNIPVSEVNDSQNALSFKVEVPSSGYLVVSDLNYPGWQIQLNHQSAVLESFAGLFRAVKIPNAGTWQIDFYYRSVGQVWMPWSIGIGILCLIGSFLGKPFSVRL